MAGLKYEKTGILSGGCVGEHNHGCETMYLHNSWTEMLMMTGCLSDAASRAICFYNWL